MAQLKYEQIKEYLKAEVLKPEAVTSMPSVRTLMRHFNVAMVTVNQALIELEHENVIIRQQGRGIVAARVVQPVDLTVAESGKPMILFASPDYPAEGIWLTDYMTEQYAVQSGFQIVHYKIHPDTTSGMLAEAVRLYKNCAALLIIPPAERYSFGDLETFGALPVPVVIIDSQFYYEAFPENFYNVSHDPSVCGELMASCLLERGHVGIGYVRNEPQSDYGNMKQNAFVKFLKKNKVSMPSSHIFSETIRCWESSLTAAQQIVGKNLKDFRRLGITALAFTSSPGAFAAVQTLCDGGFSVPDEMSVIGEGDSMWYRYGNPALTVTKTDYSGMCHRAVDIAAGKFRNEHLFSSPMELILRKSVKNIHNKPKQGE